MMITEHNYQGNYFHKNEMSCISWFCIKLQVESCMKSIIVKIILFWNKKWRVSIVFQINRYNDKITEVNINRIDVWAKKCQFCKWQIMTLSIKQWALKVPWIWNSLFLLLLLSDFCALGTAYTQETPSWIL